MGKIFKVLGYVFLGLFILALGVVGFLYFSGAFNDNKIELDTIAFEIDADNMENIESMLIGGQETLIVTDDIQMTIGYTPSNATSKTINLRVKAGQDFISVPSQVIAGEPFTIHIDKENENYGGTVIISAADVKGQTKVDKDLIFVVDRPVEDLTLFNFANEVGVSDSGPIIAFSKELLPFQLESTPLNALNPNLASSEFDTSKFFKNIKVESQDASIVEVVKNETNPTEINIANNSVLLNYYLRTVNKGTADVVATMFPTYIMDADYTATNFEKFLASDPQYIMFSTIANDCAKFVTKYKDYILSIEEQIYMPSLGKSMNGEELINELTNNGTVEISFTTDNRGADVFQDVLQFMQIKAQYSVSVVMGEVDSISVDTNSIDWILHKDNSAQPYTIDSLVSTFGLTINPENDNNNLDSLLSSIKINALLVDTTNHTFTFENYEDDATLQSIIDLLNNPETNRSTGIEGRSSLFPDFKVTNDPENYFIDGYMHYEKAEFVGNHSEILTNGIFGVKEEMRGEEKVWVMTSYNQIPDGMELYLHFSLETIMAHEDQNINVIYETIVKVNISTNTIPVDSNILIQGSIPSVLVTNESGVYYNGVMAYNTYSSDIDYATLSTSEGISEFSYTTMRYLVKQSEVQKIETNGETPCIDVVRDGQGNIVAHRLSDGEIYYEVNNSRNGVLNLRATNISPYEVEPSKVYTNAHIYSVIIKTDREGNPIYEEDGSYIVIAKKMSNDTFVVRSFIDNLYYYSAITTQEGQTDKTTYVLRNYNIPGDRLVNYPMGTGDDVTNALVLLNDTTHTATLFDSDQSSGDLNYDEIVAYVEANQGSVVITIDKNVNPIINEEMNFIVLNYIIDSNGNMYLTDDNMRETEVVKYKSALDDEYPYLTFQPGVGEVSQEDIGSYVQTIVSKETSETGNIKSFISLKVIALQDDQIDIRCVGTTNNVEDSLFMYPFYIDYDKSDTAQNLFGFQHAQATEEEYYTYAYSDNYVSGNLGEGIQNMLKLQANSNGQNIIWLVKDSAVDTTNLTSSMDFIIYGQDTDSTYYGPILYQLDTSKVDISQQGNVENYLQNFAQSTVSEWQISYYVSQTDDIADLNSLAWQSTSVENNPYLTISKDVNQNYHMNILQGTQHGVYIKLTVTLYNYELPNGVTSDYTFDGISYQIAKRFTTYIVLYQDEPVITLYSRFDGEGDGVLNGGTADEGEYRNVTAGDTVSLVGSQNESDYIVVTLSNKSIISSAYMNINLADRSKMIFLAYYGAGNNDNPTRTYEIDGTKLLNKLELEIFDSGIDSSATFTVSVAGKTSIYYLSITKNVNITINEMSANTTGNYNVEQDNNDYYVLNVEDTGTKSTPVRYALSEIFSMTKINDGQNVDITFGFVDQEDSANDYYKIHTLNGIQYLYIGRVFNTMTFDINISYKLSSEDTVTSTYYKTIRVKVNPTIAVSIEGDYNNSNPLDVVTGENYNIYENDTYYIHGTYNNAEMDVATLLNYVNVSVDRNSISAEDLVALGGLNMSSDKKSITSTFTIKNVNNVRFIIQLAQATVSINADSISLSANSYIMTDMSMYFNFKPNVSFVATNGQDNNSQENPYILQDTQIASTGTQGEFVLFGEENDLIKFVATYGGQQTDITLNVISSISLSKKVLNEDGLTYSWVALEDGYIQVVVDDNKVVINKLTSVNQDIDIRINFENQFGVNAYYYVTLKSDVLIRAHYPILANGEKVAVGTSIDLNQGYALSNNRLEIYFSDGTTPITYAFDKTYQLFADQTLANTIDTNVAEISAQGKLYVKQSISDIYIKVTLSCGSYAIYHIIVVPEGFSSGISNTTQIVKANHEYTLDELLGNAKYAALKTADGKEIISQSTYTFEETYSATKYEVQFYVYNDDSLQSEGEKIYTFQVERNITIVSNTDYSEIAANNEYQLYYTNESGENYILALTKDDGTNEYLDASMFTYSTNNENIVIAGNTIKYNGNVNSNQKVTITVEYEDYIIGTVNVTIVPNIKNLIKEDLYNYTALASYNVISPASGTGTILVSEYSSPTNYIGEDIDGTLTYSIDNLPQGVSISGDGNITYPIVNKTISFVVTATITWRDVSYSEKVTIYVQNNLDTNTIKTPTISVDAGQVIPLDVTRTGNTISLEGNALFSLRNEGETNIVLRFDEIETSDYSIVKDSDGTYSLYVYNSNNTNAIKISYYIDFIGTTSVDECYKDNLTYFYIQLNTASVVDEIAIKDGNDNAITLDTNAILLNDILNIGDNNSSIWYHSVYASDSNGNTDGHKIVQNGNETYLVFACTTEEQEVDIRLYPYSGATNFVTITFTVPASNALENVNIDLQYTGSPIVHDLENDFVFMDSTGTTEFDKSIFDYTIENVAPVGQITDSNLNGSILTIDTLTATTTLVINVTDGINTFRIIINITVATTE